MIVIVHALVVFLYRLCIDVMRFKHLYAGTFAPNASDALQRRLLLAKLSPFKKVNYHILEYIFTATSE